MCMDSRKAACCAGLVGAIVGNDVSAASHRFHCRALGLHKAAYEVI